MGDNRTARMATAVRAPKGGTAKPTQGLRIAAAMGLLEGPKTKHFNAKVSPKLFQAAARRLGTASP